MDLAFFTGRILRVHALAYGHLPRPSKDMSSNWPRRKLVEMMVSSCLYSSTNCLSCESGEVVAGTPIHTELGDNAETDVPEVIQSYPLQDHARSAYPRGL